MISLQASSCVLNTEYRPIHSLVLFALAGAAGRRYCHTRRQAAGQTWSTMCRNCGPFRVLVDLLNVSILVSHESELLLPPASRARAPLILMNSIIRLLWPILVLTVLLLPPLLLPPPPRPPPLQLLLLLPPPLLLLLLLLLPQLLLTAPLLLLAMPSNDLKGDLARAGPLPLPAFLLIGEGEGWTCSVCAVRLIFFLRLDLCELH